jgi:hypothetical protein
MKLFAVAAILTLVVAQNSGAPQPPQYHTQSTAYTSRDKDGQIFVTENSSFQFAEVYDESKDPPLQRALLEETFRNRSSDHAEAVEGSATIRSWSLKSDGTRQLSWTINATANEGSVQNRFYRTSVWGCCDAPDSYTYYSLISGKRLYSSFTDLKEVTSVKDGHSKIIYIAVGAESPENNCSRARLQLGTDRDILQTFTIVAPRVCDSIPELSLAGKDPSVNYLVLDGAAPTFSVTLDYGDGAVLQIPIRNGSIRPELATLPDGFKLQPLPH